MRNISRPFCVMIDHLTRPAPPLHFGPFNGDRCGHDAQVYMQLYVPTKFGCTMHTLSYLVRGGVRLRGRPCQVADLASFTGFGNSLFCPLARQAISTPPHPFGPTSPSHRGTTF